MVTMHDVARAAGVSLMTVSNVINDHPHVKQGTRERVLEAIDALNYKVNVAARNLRSGRTGTIGLAVPEIDRPYFGQLAALVIERAAARGFRVAVEQTGASRENELEALAASRIRLYDGLLLSTVGLGPADADLLNVEYPVVLLGERIFDGPVPHVAMPNVEGARSAVEHLISQGASRIAFIGSPESLSEIGASGLRVRGYREAVEGAGLAFDSRLLFRTASFSMPEGARVAGMLINSGVDVDAVFCANDSLAFGVLRRLADSGVRVPDDMLVIGFDDVLEARYSIPSLSTVAPDHVQMATAAVDLLAARIAKAGTAAEPTELVSDYRVVMRESTSV
ncbi:LacI family DNA-binding transcriptional regulator [Phytoactinopolyspora mesophila]|uniref:LacI family DNA-binding transcriptional regulator n=1 Tax=Phytoactinopolyspora mesophila TaxID=2650750 RepID=A0A7K3M1S8_9ACTN|nr:LacI family DNA-binding transcriptional regulator [Phytoactinopolyspora mesophila]NDL57256.1 LacI family DNA-binding transcriptional regulator [Phytoactinopolyspora mesophila]